VTTGLRLDAAVLAAGAGSRFGGEKLTSAYGGATLLDASLAAAFAAPVRSVIVVFGADAKVPIAASAFHRRERPGPRLVMTDNPDFGRGLSTSLRAAVKLTPLDCEGLFLFLGDMPRIPRSILAPMAKALDEGALAVAPVFQGQRGHPVLIARPMFSQLLELEGDKGAGGLLDALGEGLTTVVAPDDGVLFDVDTREG